MLLSVIKMFGPEFLVIVLIVGCGTLAEGSETNSKCQTNWNLEQMLNKMKICENIKLSDGVKFIKVNGSFEQEEGRSGKVLVLSRVKRFLNNYSLELKFPDVYKRKHDIENGLRKGLTALNRLVDYTTSRATATPFAGGKKVGGPLMMMATMLGGTVAALGFGSLAMLVMKALTVSVISLIISGILGLRRLFNLDDFGRLSYIPVHPEHVRRRRSLHDLPYRAYLSGT